MTKIYAQSVVFLLLLSIIISSPLLTYDPTASSSTVTLLSKDSNSFRWLYKRITGSTYSIESVSLDMQATDPANKVSTKTYNAATIDFSFKAVSSSYTCALLVSGTTKLSLVTFTANDLLQEDLIASQFVVSGTAAVAVGKAYQVSDACTALCVDGGATYRYDVGATGTTKFVADTVTTWTAPVFNGDFSFAAANDGVYIYTPKTANAAGNYAKIFSGTFLANKRVWSTSSGIVVFSWDSTGTSDIKNYKVHSIARPGVGQTAYTLVGTIEGQFYNTNVGAAPEISVSDRLEIVLVSGKSAAATQFSKTKRFNYALKTAVDINLPSWVTETESTFSVSNTFIYVRNNVNKAGTSDQFHGGFSIDAFGAGLYFAPIALTPPQKANNYMKTLMDLAPSGQLFVLTEHNTLANELGVLTLEPAWYAPAAQFFKWDRTLGLSTAVYAGDGTLYSEVDGRPVWFAQTKPTGTTQAFYSVVIDPATNLRLTATLSTDNQQIFKAVSKNFKCAVIIDNTGTPVVKVYDFSITTSDRTVTSSRTVASALYTGVVLDDPFTKFDVSDNCNAVRIGNVFVHLSSGVYAADTVPASTNLVNPVCSEDLSIIVAQNGIYAYSATTRAYTLVRSETIQTQKKVWRNMGNLVILTYQESNTVGIYDYKLQFNSISQTEPITITKINETISNSRMMPWISVSQKLSKVILGGIDVTDSTKANYIGKSIDWVGKTTRDMTLPPAITTVVNKFAISEAFLYVRNSQSATPKQIGYALIGSTIVEAFNENTFVSSEGYSRSFLIPDPASTGKMVVVHQYSNGPFIRLLKEQKKNSRQILNPNQVPPFDMTFNYGSNSLIRQPAPAFGRWIWSQSSGTILNFLEYDPSQAGKKKTISINSLTSGSILKTQSPEFDCAISMSTSATTFDTVKFDTTNAGTATKTSHWAAVSADNSAAAIDNAVIQAGNACWAFRINNLVYVKPAAAGTYVKSAISASDFSTAIFDDSLKFALIPASGKVYKYGSTDYVNIFNVTGLKTTTFIKSSPDSERLMIFSYNNTLISQGVPYDAVIKLYVSDGTNYNQVTLPNDGAIKTRVSDPKIFFDPYFNTIVVGFASGTDAAPKVNIHVANVDYAARKVAEYPIPPVWFTWANPNFFIFGEYVYCMQPTVPNVPEGIQYFFKLDKTNLKIPEITRRPVNTAEFQTFMGGKVLEENGLISVIYDSEPTTEPVGTVRLIKRGVGSPTLQNTMRDIVPQDAGFLVENGQIRLCSPGCSYCINPTICSTCSTGYVLNSVTSSCIRCGPLCGTCTESDPTTCVTCVPGYYPTTVNGNPTCSRCHDSCITCTGATASSCTSCKIGAYLDTNTNSCTDCISNCIACTSGAVNACDTCKPGYVYNVPSKTCVKCIAGCAVCNPTQVYTCINCGAGFEPVLSANNTITQCKPCPPRCKNCINGACTECRPGFRLNNNNCTEQCRLPCQECTEKKADSCTSCLGGYTLDPATGVCAPDLTCNSNKSCTSCPIGFNLVTGECKPCNGGQNCRTCDNIDIDKCASCVRGFFLTETLTCAPCNITGCSACDNPVYCSQCKPGYILSGTGLSAKCTKCAPQCASCFESPNNCDLCAPGFTKKGWNCISNINVQLTLVLNGNFSALTTDQYEGIEAAIANQIGKDRSQITVNELRESSILLDATINMDNSAQQSTMMGQLQSSLTFGGSLAGFTIESAGLQSNSDVAGVKDDNEISRYRNIAIIVGIVIPICLIILFIVLIILFKKGIIFNPSNGPTKIRDSTMDEIQLKDVNSLQ